MQLDPCRPQTGWQGCLSWSGFASLERRLLFLLSLEDGAQASPFLVNRFATMGSVSKSSFNTAGKQLEDIICNCRVVGTLADREGAGTRCPSGELHRGWHAPSMLGNVKATGPHLPPGGILHGPVLLH